MDKDEDYMKKLISYLRQGVKDAGIEKALSGSLTDLYDGRPSYPHPSWAKRQLPNNGNIE